MRIVAPPPANHLENSAWPLRSVLKLIWINLSIFIFIVIFLELGAYLYYTAHTAISRPGDPIAAQVNAIPADAYADRSWLMAGFNELHGAAAVQWEPYTYYTRKPFSGSYVNIDPHGWRRTWNLPTPQPVEIYMFGGSTMFGIGARDDYTIPSILSKMLAQVFPGQIHVTNYGRTGFVSTQEMILLLRELERGCRPQIVIFYDGFNDTFSAFQSRTAGIPLNEYNRVAEFNILHPSRARDFLLKY